MDAFVIAKELCTGSDGAAISNRTPDCGFGVWENAVGLFALGASIQSNKIARTSQGSAGFTHHVMQNASGFPTDLLNYCCDLGRPGDANSQEAGIFFRNNGVQFNAATNDGVYVTWRRVSSTLVDIKVLVQNDGSNTQQSTRTTNYAWAESTDKCLGLTVSGASLQVWTAPALASRAGVLPATSERTNQGSALTLTPDVHNDDTHRYYGAVCQRGITPFAHTWDNFYVWVDNPTPVSYLKVVDTDLDTRTISWPAKTGLGAITYDVQYSLNGTAWVTLATDQAGTSYEWNNAALGARWVRTRVRYGNPCQNGPWRMSAPFQINVA